MLVQSFIRFGYNKASEYWLEFILFKMSNSKVDHWSCPICHEGDDGYGIEHHSCGKHQYHRRCISNAMAQHEEMRTEYHKHVEQHGNLFLWPEPSVSWECIMCKYMKNKPLAVTHSSKTAFKCDYCGEIIDVGRLYNEYKICGHKFHPRCTFHYYDCHVCK